jgi:hypothetical protein
MRRTSAGLRHRCALPVCAISGTGRCRWLPGELPACSTDEQSRGLKHGWFGLVRARTHDREDSTVALPNAFGRGRAWTCLEGIAGHGGAAMLDRPGGRAWMRGGSSPARRTVGPAREQARVCGAGAPGTAWRHEPGRARAVRNLRARSPAGHRATHDRPGAPASAGACRFAFIARASTPRASVLSWVRRRSDGGAGASAG